jgi:hypothetical protein
METCQAQRQVLQKPHPPGLLAGEVSWPMQPLHGQFSDWIRFIAAARSNIGSMLTKQDRNR